jgi:hypothetical protein
VATRLLIAGTVAAIATLVSATPAVAQVSPPPCELALAFVCNLLPTAPDLEHGIDLTQNQPPADPNSPPPESLPVADPCAAGCI